MDLSLKPCTTTGKMHMDMDMDMDPMMKPCTTAGSLDMDMILRPCTTTTSVQEEGSERPLIDRLSSLPNELLIWILCLLPTKDAAATCVLSKRLIRFLYLMSSLDFDVSPISHCATHPYKIQHFPCFVAFVDTVLSSYQSQCLTKFRLRVSMDFNTKNFRGCSGYSCGNQCLPDLNSNQIQTWISFPFTRCGLKELDLCIHTQFPDCNLPASFVNSYVQLPPAIFMCESLETLKLDVNLGLDQVYTMSSFCLPNLKLLHLRASLISEDGFVSRLVSSCPLLEDLVVEAVWNRLDCLRICSSSLRRLRFKVFRVLLDTVNSGFVTIDTPNLEDLRYFDETESYQYSVTNLDRVAKASIEIDNALKVLDFIRPLSNVKHLCLNSCLKEYLDSLTVMHQLPVFRNLKYLELGYQGNVYWDIVLSAFLERSPVLETLAFFEGLVGSDDRNYHMEAPEFEQSFFRTAQVGHFECCKSHLKRIVIHRYFGDEREIDLIRFLLRHALVLEELVILPYRRPYEIPDQKSMESTLRNLPKASINCFIQVLG